MINAHGVTYTTVEQAREAVAALEADNARYGASDGRVTEINAINAAIAEQAPAVVKEQGPRETVVVDDEDGRWTVVRSDFESPCEHPQCALLHRRFFTGTERNDQWVSMPITGEQRRFNVVGWHEKTNRQWVVLRNGSRVADAYDTKREAVREAEKKPLY